MRRTLALCSCRMPSAVSRKDIIDLPSWRAITPASTPSGRRYNSTEQGLRIGTESLLPPSVLHGRKLTGKDGSTSKKQDKAAKARSQKEPGLTTSLSNSQPSPQTMESTVTSPWQKGKSSNEAPRGTKRRADATPKPPVARRRRSEVGVELKDEAYIRRTSAFPSKDEYPHLPQGLLDRPKTKLYNALQGIVKFNSVYSPITRRNFRCVVSFTLPERESTTGVGEGTTKRAAENAAYLHLVAKLHENGILHDLFDKSMNEELDKQTLQDEAEAKTDIYNYAARFDCIPTISVRAVNRPLRARARRLVEVTVDLPEQSINVSGRGQNMKTAEIAAGIRFKQEAEKYHAEHGSSSIVIKDSTALNTGNIRNFLEFYKIINPGVKIEVRTETVKEYKAFGVTPFRGQVWINEKPVGEQVDMINKKKVEDVAYLTAAIALKKSDPQLYPQYLKALHAGNGEILRPVAPISMTVDEDCVLVMRETLLAVRKAGLPDEQDELPSDEDASETRRLRSRHKLTPRQVDTRGASLQTAYHEYLKNPELAELRRKREELPMNAYRAQVLDIVNNNMYSIIVGATGSGKTTQVPQILLEEAIKDGHGASCNVICTQPRRIAATSVARRVAEERAEKLQDSVGYHVRFDAKLPQLGGSVTYCTTGILLQQLQHSPEEVLDGTSHLIIDEVHERDLLIDFLLIILKKVMTQRVVAGKPTPKVVLMSATMDTELFASYFKSNLPGKATSNCPALSVPGRTFPVKEQHLENILETIGKDYIPSQVQLMQTDPVTREYLDVERKFGEANPATGVPSPTEDSEGDEFHIDWKQERKLSADGELVISNERENALVPYGLVATTIAHIVKTSQDGAILVFLPGLDEIVKVNELLRQGRVMGVDFLDESKFKLFMLHSSIPAGQTEVFEAVSQGCRKIILSTNIAETSITIPDVQYVVDTGKLREKQYDQIRRITKLQCTWISKSNSRQRAGRAGRVQNGHYYALFSKARYDSMRAIGLPEMLRADLQETCLDIKAQAFKSPIREFLAEAIEPPAPKAVDASVRNLQALDALTDDEKITPLGRLLASLPVHPALGKMIILGVVFRCLDPMLILGAAAEERSIFANPLEKRRAATDARISFMEGSGSDHIALLNAVREMRRLRDRRGLSAMYDFGHQNFIHIGAFRTVDATAKQIEDILVEAGLIPNTPSHARHDSEFGHPALNENSSKVPVIKALTLAGLHPNIAVNNGGRTFRTPGEKGTMVHPSSVNAPRDRRIDEDERFKYGSILTYSTMARSNDGNSIFLRDTSEITPLMANLFGGRLQMRDVNANILEMDSWLPFFVKSGDRRAAKTILEFRKALERLLVGAFRDLSSRKSLAEDPVRERFAEGLVEVLGRDIRVKEAVARRGWRLAKGLN